MLHFSFAQVRKMRAGRESVCVELCTVLASSVLLWAPPLSLLGSNIPWAAEKPTWGARCSHTEYVLLVLVCIWDYSHMLKK